MENRKKILDKIKKVLELSKNNPSQAEAAAAALKAQKLMAEYRIEMIELEDDSEKEAIGESRFKVGNGNKWKGMLAHVVGKNFRCEHYFIGKDTIVFYGYENDTKIATETFKTLFTTGNRLANRFYQQEKKASEREYGYFNGKGIKNAFLARYVDGIEDALDRQCTTLMIITPKEVKEGFEEKVSGFKKISNNFKYRANQKAMDAGYSAGKNAVAGRYIA